MMFQETALEQAGYLKGVYKLIVSNTKLTI